MVFHVSHFQQTWNSWKTKTETGIIWFALMSTQRKKPEVKFTSSKIKKIVRGVLMSLLFVLLVAEIMGTEKDRLKDQDFINLLLVLIVSKFTDKEFSVLILEGENISSMQSQIKQVIHQTAKILCPHPLPFKQCFLPFPIYFAFAEWVLYSAVEFYSSPRKREQWSSRHRRPGWPYRCTSMSCVWQRSL